MGRMESIMAGGGLPLLQCVRTRINRRNQSRTSIGLRESPLSPWSQFNPGGLSNTGSQRPHDYPTSRELSASRPSLSLSFSCLSLGLDRPVSTLSFVALAGCRSCGYAARKTKSEHEQLPPKRMPRRPLNSVCTVVRDIVGGFFNSGRRICISFSCFFFLNFNRFFCYKFLIIRNKKKEKENVTI